MLKLVWVFILLSSIQFNGMASFKLTISPDHAHVLGEGPLTASLKCSADVPLAGCQWRYWDDSRKEGPLMDLSRGAESQADPAHYNKELLGYNYTGQGLGAGECGVSLNVTNTIRWMVACRVRAEAGGWQYAWTDLDHIDYDAIPLTPVTPSEAVVLPGGEAKFFWKTNTGLNRCIFFLFDQPGFFEIESEGGSTPNHGEFSRYRHLGKGTYHGDCGIAVANVSEADNGPVHCFMADNRRPFHSSHIFMALIVARSPSSTKLHLTYTATDVTATCEVHDSRPIAKLSWILGDDNVIRQDETDDSQATALDEWRWPWMKGSILQRLTLPVAHNGETLTCKVTHVAAVTPLEAKEIITFP